ncbi:hypothetical protein [Falsiruegeria litorea]|uniref:hypothetical protein n=1 Tax=Falsiruegeria litorea TaxID=1280831 RepID=UPI001BFE210A|nr:hypothetical protein [Falsiruegeria litorea]MBT8169867.1 hypothetical protein [Falsiruegeria litorea]
MQSDNAAAAAGGAGLTVPLWLASLDPFIQILIAGISLGVLVLTGINKWFEIKIKRAKLREAERGETETQ